MIPSRLAITRSIRVPGGEGQLAYSLGRMRLRLRPVVEEIEKRRTDEECYTEDVRAYLKRRNELALAHAVRNEAGQPIPDHMGNIQIGNLSAYEGAVKSYEELHPGIDVEFKAQDKALRDWLNEDVTFEKWKAERAWLPKDASPEEIEAIFDLLDIAEEPGK
jgi:hypothetical protein